MFYSQDNIDHLSSELKPGNSKVEVIDGQIWKFTKDKQSEIVEREQGLDVLKKQPDGSWKIYISHAYPMEE